MGCEWGLARDEIIVLSRSRSSVRTPVFPFRLLAARTRPFEFSPLKPDKMSEPEHHRVTYNEVHNLIRVSADKIAAFKPDMLIAIGAPPLSPHLSCPRPRAHATAQVEGKYTALAMFGCGLDSSDAEASSPRASWCVSLPPTYAHPPVAHASVRLHSGRS